MTSDGFRKCQIWQLSLTSKPTARGADKFPSQADKDTVYFNVNSPKDLRLLLKSRNKKASLRFRSKMAVSSPTHVKTVRLPEVYTIFSPQNLYKNPLTVIGSGTKADTAVANAFPTSKVMKIARIWKPKPAGGRSIM